MQETGPTVYSPYPRRPERLTIGGYNYKGSTFASCIEPLKFVNMHFFSFFGSAGIVHGNLMADYLSLC